jgi:hypothetical protein
MRKALESVVNGLESLAAQGSAQKMGIVKGRGKTKKATVRHER